LNLPPPDALERNCSKGFRKYCSRKHIQNKLLTHNSKAFTLSEVLIALVIIGIVTILTVPHFLNNLQDKEFLTASKRINYLISQAVGQLNVSSGITAATSPEDFVNNYLSKVLKLTKVCGYSNHADCGFSTKIKDVKKNKTNLPTLATNLTQKLTGGDGTWNNVNTNGYSFVTLNGYSMMLFYNQNCLDDVTNAYSYGNDRICINILYDINGSKKPNQLTKDIGFTTVLYPTNSKIVTPIPAPEKVQSTTFNNAGENCKKYGKDYRPPNKDELTAMCFNGNLIGMHSYYWSSSSDGITKGWHLYGDSCERTNYLRGNVFPVHCIKNS
jgi:prepilin-type N-terminal cleavage/methylation domain-containing protein